jgi:phosphatidate cytidylyltransferase
MPSFLSKLTPEQQVGLLFVLLFGLLALATVAGILVSLRESKSSATEPSAQVQRLDGLLALLRTAWPMALVFWVGWAAGDGVATVLFGFVSFLILREFISLSPTRRGDHRSLLLAFFVVLPLQYTLAWTRQFDLFTVFIPVYVFLAIAGFSALSGDTERFLERNAKLQWGIMVCVYGMSHVPALLMLDFPGFKGKTAFLVFFLVLVVQTCMLVQHLSATRWRPATAATPNDRFRWRSWVAGLLAGSLVGVLLAGLTPFNLPTALAMALVACVAGTLGHLVMKAIKRDRGVIHWGADGRSLTGASGLLDRVDALCFAAPVFFHSVRWTFNL